MEFINERNERNIFPKIHELTGTQKNWAYPMTRAGYLTNENDGIHITLKGNELLTHLRTNPPQGRGKSKKSKLLMQSDDTSSYSIHIHGADLQFDIVVSKSKVMQLLKVISQIEDTHSHI